MKECKECGGTGIAINNKFCRCEAGKGRKKEIHDKMLMSVGSEPKKEIATDPAKEMQTYFESSLKDKINKHIGFEVGQWVEHGGMIGIVDAMDVTAGKIRFLGYKVIGDTKPIGGNVQGWVFAKSVKAAPMETFKNANKMLIDLALMTGDKEWFNELTKG